MHTPDHLPADPADNPARTATMEVDVVLPYPSARSVLIRLADGRSLGSFRLDEARDHGIPIPERPSLADRVRLEHIEDCGECRRCDQSWPCDTRQLLDQLEAAGS